MTINEFTQHIKKSLPTGTILKNPGGGTSEITGYTENKISYVRGSSKMYVSFEDLYNTYSKYKGKCVTSSELKVFAPHIFDSSARPAGHSCNCTLLFLILNRLNLSGNIKGAGARGNPFFVVLYD